jgi:hypothetical protein
MGSGGFLSDTAQRGFPRRVLLVQAPIGKSFQSIASALDWSTSAKGPVCVAIDWDSTDIDTIPTMKSHISFVRHFAVCLIDDDIWTKSTYTLLEKFMTARFWEHPGASSGSEAQQRNSTCWSEADIKQIDAIQEVGITRLNLNEIRENCKSASFDLLSCIQLIVISRLPGPFQRLELSPALVELPGLCRPARIPCRRRRSSGHFKMDNASTSHAAGTGGDGQVESSDNGWGRSWHYGILHFLCCGGYRRCSVSSSCNFGGMGFGLRVRYNRFHLSSN